MMRLDKNVLLFLALGMYLGSVGGAAAAGEIVLSSSADTMISQRQYDNRYAKNWGGTTILAAGHQGTDLDNLCDSLIRFNLSSLVGQTITGDAILTLKQETQYYGNDARDFDGQTLDVYAMPLANTDWVEGTGSQAAVAGVAWNRKKGDYSLDPLEADKWLPVASNNPEYGITKIASVTYDKATMGDDPYEITIPLANLQQWITDGVVSFLIRSDSVIALGGTDRHFEAIWSKEFGAGGKSPLLTVSVPDYPGDADRNGVVNEADAAILAQNWLATGADWSKGDFNGDTVVNDIDATMMAANWLVDFNAGPAASVPEPGCAVLLAGIALALCFRFIRRR